MTAAAALAEAVRTEPDIARSVAAAVGRWSSSVRVVLAGRPGVGCSTVAEALGRADCEVLTVDDPRRSTDVAIVADVVVYVIAVSATAADEAAVRALVAVPGVEVVVVLTKVDAPDGSWSTIEEAVHRHRVSLSAPTCPLVASLAVVTQRSVLSAEECRLFEVFAEWWDPALPVTPELFLRAPVEVDSASRRALLARWDVFGVACALDVLRADPDVDATRMLAILRAVSGLDSARLAVEASVARASRAREVVLLAELERCAARSLGGARDVIEDFLREVRAGECGAFVGAVSAAGGGLRRDQ